jgi:hypothetical protein
MQRQLFTASTVASIWTRLKKPTLTLDCVTPTPSTRSVIHSRFAALSPTVARPSRRRSALATTNASSTGLAVDVNQLLQQLLARARRQPATQLEDNRVLLRRELTSHLARHWKARRRTTLVHQRRYMDIRTNLKTPRPPRPEIRHQSTNLSDRQTLNQYQTVLLSMTNHQHREMARHQSDDVVDRHAKREERLWPNTSVAWPYCRLLRSHPTPWLWRRHRPQRLPPPWLRLGPLTHRQSRHWPHALLSCHLLQGLRHHQQ